MLKRAIAKEMISTLSNLGTLSWIWRASSNSCKLLHMNLVTCTHVMKAGLVQLCWSHSYDHAMCSIVNKHAPPKYHIKPWFLYHFTTFLKLVNFHLHNYKAENCYVCKCCVQVEVGTICSMFKLLKISTTPNMMSFQNSKLAASLKDVLKLCT